MASNILKTLKGTMYSSCARRLGQRSALGSSYSRRCSNQTFHGKDRHFLCEGEQQSGYQFLVPAIFNRAVRSQWMALRSVTLGGDSEREPVSISQILAPSFEESNDGSSSLFGDESALVFSSTLKKRAMKMNKHKLKKRRKALRMNTKRSRG
jgi:hypothetical protein